MPPARLGVRMDSLFPFLQGSYLPYNMSVYPGALRLAGKPLGPRHRVATGSMGIVDERIGDFATFEIIDFDIQVRSGVFAARENPACGRSNAITNATARSMNRVLE